MPTEYKKLFLIKNPKNLYKIVKNESNENISLVDGAYVTLEIADPGIISAILAQPTSNPLVISSLLKHECKITLNHARVKSFNQLEKNLPSNENYLIHLGFKKLVKNLLFSQIYGGTDKVKSVKKIRPSPFWYLTSFYGSLSLGPLNFVVFDSTQKNTPPLLIGSFLSSNLSQVILERKILTGHPQRAKKKWCIIKFLFFNPEDAKYFLKNDVYTKHGLKGKLKETLGTHGLVKSSFSGSVKQSDTICMNLYKRVFPHFQIDPLNY